MDLIFTEPDSNAFDRLRCAQPGLLQLTYEAQVETFVTLLNPEHLRKANPAQLDPTVLPYLFPSRYCQSDRLGRLAWQKFGSISHPYDQVLAVTDWIYKNIQYQIGSTKSDVSAYDTLTERVGVCRDFSHLAIALCRALNIPARYLSAYACNMQPPDFHACFEAYIGDTWLVFDATCLASVNGLVRIGHGRDAADVSICTIFGLAQLTSQSVSCVSIDQTYQPLDVHQTAVCLGSVVSKNVLV